MPHMKRHDDDGDIKPLSTPPPKQKAELIKIPTKALYHYITLLLHVSTKLFYFEAYADTVIHQLSLLIVLTNISVCHIYQGIL